MKRKLLSVIAVVLLSAGLAMLIAPRISNRVGEQIAHTTIEDFKALKSKATSDEPTEKKESSEDSVSIPNPAADSSKSNHDHDWQIKDEEGCIKNSELSDSGADVDFDRLYSDSPCHCEGNTLYRSSGSRCRRALLSDAPRGQIHPDGARFEEKRRLQYSRTVRGAYAR